MDGVLDQVEREPVELVADAVDHNAVADHGAERVRSGERLRFGDRLDSNLPEVDRRRGALAGGVGAGQQQQIGDQAPHPPRRAQRSVGGFQLLAAELVGQQFQVRQHTGQRRAQFVRGVGDELALMAQCSLGLDARALQRREHLVERPRQLSDLVVRGGLGNLQG